MKITKSGFVLMLLSLIVLSPACKTRHKSGKARTGLTETFWELTEMPGYDPEDLSKMWLRLEDGSEKKVSGFAGCNRFFGMYEVSEKHLEFGNLGSTKMYCPEMETETSFLEKLGEVDNFKISDSNLILYSGKIKVLVFHATSLEEIQKRE
jgi:heat shock protein HslJ